MTWGDLGANRCHRASPKCLCSYGFGRERSETQRHFALISPCFSQKSCVRKRHPGRTGIFCAVLCKEVCQGGTLADNAASAITSRQAASGGPHGPPFSFAGQRHSTLTPIYPRPECRGLLPLRQCFNLYGTPVCPFETKAVSEEHGHADQHTPLETSRSD